MGEGRRNISPIFVFLHHTLKMLAPEIFETKMCELVGFFNNNKDILPQLKKSSCIK